MTFEQWCHETDSVYRGYARAGWDGAIEAARSVIDALIEFGGHLDYCRTKKEVHAAGHCDCGRDEAVSDAMAFLALVTEPEPRCAKRLTGGGFDHVCNWPPNDPIHDMRPLFPFGEGDLRHPFVAQQEEPNRGKE